MRRKNIYLFFIISLFSCSSKLPLPEPQPNPDPNVPSEKIDWNVFADNFQNTLQSTYKDKVGTYFTRPDKKEFNYWYNAHVMDVLVDGYNRTKDEKYVSLMKDLLRGIKLKNWGTYWKVYVDDMDWLGISCMNAYDATKNAEFKKVADYILTEIKKAHTDVLGGGLQWRFDQPNAKHACSTGPGAIVALRIYAIDKKEEDLSFAKKLYEWQTNTLLDPNTFLVWDHIRINDNGITEIKKDWTFTYNVGTYIGMACGLYEATKDKQYLDAAVKSAHASITNSLMVSDGMFKETGDHDGGLFKGILIRYLTELYFISDVPISSKKEIASFITNNAIILREKGTSPPPTIFASSDWSIRPERAHDVSTQLSAMMLIEAMAKL